MTEGTKKVIPKTWIAGAKIDLGGMGGGLRIRKRRRYRRSRPPKKVFWEATKEKDNPLKGQERTGMKEAGDLSNRKTEGTG